MRTNQPVAISAAIGGVLSTGVALAAVFWPERLDPLVQGLVIAFGNSVILAAGAIYAAARSTPVNNPTLPAGTSVNVQNTEDAVIIAPSPPGPRGVEGGAEGAP